MWKSSAKGMFFFGRQRENKPPKPLPAVNQSTSFLILMIGEYTNISREANPIAPRVLHYNF